MCTGAIPTRPTMTTNNQILDALLEFRLGDQSARWNFSAAVGTSIFAPGGSGTPVSLTYSLPSALPGYDAALGIRITARRIGIFGGTFVILGCV